jgi:hypothetical protein
MLRVVLATSFTLIPVEPSRIFEALGPEAAWVSVRASYYISIEHNILAGHGIVGKVWLS